MGDIVTEFKKMADELKGIAGEMQRVSIEKKLDRKGEDKIRDKIDDLTNDKKQHKIHNKVLRPVHPTLYHSRDELVKAKKISEESPEIANIMSALGRIFGG